MIEFKRNKKTGTIEVWKDRKKIGAMSTMGDSVKKGSNNASKKN